MNFFQAQDQARHNTTRLVVLFVLAVISLIVMTNLLIMAVFAYINSRGSLETQNLFQGFDWSTFGIVSIGVAAVIVAGSLYKLAQLAGGGKVVAESLGGRLISKDSNGLLQRRVLNVVEEMSIASGTPVPPVYVLDDEPGINAFAAGFTTGDAVIAVTRGCLEQLSRDELQGVIAHEFSHILNGDMRMNIRLIGILHGILIIGLIGYFILRSGVGSSRSRSSRSGNGALAIFALGGGLMAIGFAGTFFGNMIKATLSRQREFLADASAVQFTRNPEGIAGALKKIGGLSEGSIIENPSAPEMSHAYFSNGVSSFMSSIFATHPPLVERITRLDKHWDGKFIHPKPQTTIENEQVPAASEADRLRGAAVITGAVLAGNPLMQAIDTVGQPSDAHVRYARAQLQQIPGLLMQAAREAYKARAVIYVLLIHKDAQIRDKQLLHLKQYADDGIYEETIKLLTQIKNLDPRHRLPLIDIAVGSLRQLSPQQYAMFRDNLHKLMQADNRIDLFEWALQKNVLTHLDNEFSDRPPMQRTAKYTDIAQLESECTLILSLLAHCENADSDRKQAAFAAGVGELALEKAVLLPESAISLALLNAAMDKLALLKPLVKPRLLKACVACITADGEVSATEAELLRALSAVIDCPMPPLNI